jgi:hypothetical protein
VRSADAARGTHSDLAAAPPAAPPGAAADSRRRLRGAMLLASCVLALLALLAFVELGRSLDAIAPAAGTAVPRGAPASPQRGGDDAQQRVGDTRCSAPECLPGRT